MKNIAIALDKGTPSQRNEITKYFSSKSWAYWHWIDDFWIVQVPNEYTTHSLHIEIEKLSEIGTSTILVFELNGRTNFWGRNVEKAWEWLKHIGDAR